MPLTPCQKASKALEKVPDACRGKYFSKEKILNNQATKYRDLKPVEQLAIDTFIDATNFEGGVYGYRRLLEVVFHQIVADHGNAGVQVFMGLVSPSRSASVFVIWSWKEKRWWKSDGEGYTTDWNEAGKFTLEDLDGLSLDGTAHLDLQGWPTQCDVLIPVEKP